MTEQSELLHQNIKRFIVGFAAAEQAFGFAQNGGPADVNRTCDEWLQRSLIYLNYTKGCMKFISDEQERSKAQQRLDILIKNMKEYEDGLKRPNDQAASAPNPAPGGV